MELTKTIEIIKKQFNENTNSHVFLVETNNIENCLKDIKGIIIEQLDDNPVIISQIENESYLEHIIIRPDGKEIKKDQILELQERLKTKPILSNNIFYTILPAESLSEISSNKLLKTIEEPNEGIIGFLITTNSDQILSTIKSRCEQVKFLYSHEEDESNNIIQNSDLIKSLICAIENINHVEFSNILQEKEIKDYYKEIENLLKDYYNMACDLYIKTNLDQNIVKFLKEKNKYTSLVKKAKIINTFHNKLNENMNSYLFLEYIYLKFKEVSQ